MSKIIDIRITKTELEQMLLGVSLLNCMQFKTGNSSQRPSDTLHMLYLNCMTHKVDDLIAKDSTGRLTLSEKLATRLEKMLKVYDKL